MFWKRKKKETNYLKRVFSFNHPVDPYLDVILSKCIDSGIDNIESKDLCLISITFKNGIEMIGWNENKYYAWLSQGVIGKYQWNRSRPSKDTMNRLINKMAEYGFSQFER